MVYSIRASSAITFTLDYCKLNLLWAASMEGEAILHLKISELQNWNCLVNGSGVVILRAGSNFLVSAHWGQISSQVHKHWQLSMPGLWVYSFNVSRHSVKVKLLVTVCKSLYVQPWTSLLSPSLRTSYLYQAVSYFCFSSYAVFYLGMDLPSQIFQAKLFTCIKSA